MGIGDGFGGYGGWLDSKVVCEYLCLAFKAGDPAIRVMEYDQVKRAGGIDAFNLGDGPEHSHSFQRRWGDTPTDVPQHKRFAWFETKQMCRINARVQAANDHRAQRRHQWQARDEVLFSEIVVPFNQGF